MCTNMMVVMEMHLAWAQGAKCLVQASERLGNCHTCFKSLVVSRLEQSENVASISIVRLCLQLPCQQLGVWPAGQLKVHPVVSARAYRRAYKNTVKSMPETDNFELRCWYYLDSCVCSATYKLRFMRVSPCRPIILIHWLSLFSLQYHFEPTHHY